ncbi:MAG: alpha/beta fold hydrolase [Lysobacteraceae bacterium]|nr:MAG: alpha/beta fold hydrolase [Xanthomonadaceae bacterium]
MRRRFFSAALCLLLLPCAALAQQTGHPDGPATQTRFVDVGGHKLRVQVTDAATTATSTPTVVFDSGLGGGLRDWNPVVSEIARFTRVVTYDRAGLGESQPGPEPRSFTQAATELHTLLRNAGIAPPYVLVGHSLGGANIRAFAHLYKDEVAGLVFVDPFSENSFKFDSPEEIEEVTSQHRAMFKEGPQAALAELEFADGEVRNGFPQLASYGAPPDVPMMLLVAGRDRPPKWGKLLLEQYGSWMADATEGGVVLTPDSSHYIQRDDPALVISAIRKVVFPSVQIALEREIREKGVAAAIARYRQMRLWYPADDFGERTLNVLGYEQLRAKRTQEAISLFKLNVEMFPDSGNVHDSLGEAYMVQGERDAAIASYRRSLALDPGNTNASEMLEKLEKER